MSLFHSEVRPTCSANGQKVAIIGTLTLLLYKSSEPFVDFYFTFLFIESCDLFLLRHSCNIRYIKNPLERLFFMMGSISVQNMEPFPFSISAIRVPESFVNQTFILQS